MVPVVLVVLVVLVALAQLAAIVNPANKPTKVKWSLSWSRALENCGKAVHKGLIRDWLLWERLGV